MKNHFLVTISNETDHLFGVHFICSFFNKISDNQVTLLHICRSDSSKKEHASMWQKPDDSCLVPVPPEAQRSIKKAQKMLTDSKVPLDQLITKAVAEKSGKIKDILAESARGHYDAIVLGRRVSYTLQWMFERPADETFQAMIREHSCVSPLWICPDVEPGRKNVLLCIDASENSYRAVDHVGYILSSQDQHTITLLYVENSLSTECVDFFERAVSILQNHNISSKRIKRKVVWGVSVAGTILSESKKGNYAVVAMGMGGQNISKSSGKMAGKTTAKVMSKLEKTSIWCCP
ncbi:MAG: hypothetical protein ACI8ZB_002710 [Desulforhopalus sp.]|jgi:hypothetical protein